MDIVTAFLSGRIIVPYDNVVTSVAILEMFEDLKLCPSMIDLQVVVQLFAAVQIKLSLLHTCICRTNVCLKLLNSINIETILIQSDNFKFYFNV